MKSYLKNKFKERLTYCQDWKYSIDLYLANREITRKTNDEYYEKRPFLKLFLNIYFLPNNLLKVFKYFRLRHEYKKNKIEIEVLNKELNNDQNGVDYEV